MKQKTATRFISIRMSGTISHRTPYYRKTAMSDQMLDQMIHSISNKTGLETGLVERILFNGILDWYEDAKKNQCLRMAYLQEEAKEMGLTLASVYDVETSLMNSDLKFIEDQGYEFIEA